MKHILVLISILLLSCPLFGQSKKKGLLYIWENGSRYVGEWKDGKKHGQGTITFSDGNKGVGEFRGNKPWYITTYDKDGNIIWMMLNGVKVEKKILFRDTPRSNNDPKEVKHYSSQVDALLKCIKGERTALGLPNHIVGMPTYGSVVEGV